MEQNIFILTMIVIHQEEDFADGDLIAALNIVMVYYMRSHRHFGVKMEKEKSGFYWENW